MIDHTGRNLYFILIPNSVTDQNDLIQEWSMILSLEMIGPCTQQMNINEKNENKSNERI
jgi:hypothetical protein